MSNEQIFLNTLIEALQSDGHNNVALLLRPAKIEFDYTSIFNKVKWNQCKCYIKIKVPIGVKKSLEAHKKLLSHYCYQIFEETDEYAYEDLLFGIMMDTTPVKAKEIGTVETYSKQQIYKNLLEKIAKANIDKIEAAYLSEACNCALSSLPLSAITMLGCAAECLLEQICNSYLVYLKNGNGTTKEITNFEVNAVNAKKAHARLDTFQRTVQNQERLFEQLGLENSNLHFSYLNLLRQVRNESGHPTGFVVSSEDMNSYFANYQLLIERVHPIIASLPTYSASGGSTV